MNHSRLFTLLLFINIVSGGCTAQVTAEPRQGERIEISDETPAAPAEAVQAKDTTDHDPYFTESPTIKSSIGPQSITRNIMQDRNGTIWLATWEGIMSYDGEMFTNHTNEDSLRRYHVFSMLEASNGDLWFGTIGAGVYRYDGTTFTNYTTKEGLAYDRTGCFYEDDEGKIWIGTEMGISVFDGETFQNLTTDDGLLNNDVNSIVQDDNGNYWIGTRGWATVYDGKTFTKLVGPDGGGFGNIRCIIKDRHGNMWFGGNGGMWQYTGVWDGISASFSTTGAFVRHAKPFVGYIYEDRQGNIWTSAESPDNRIGWALSRYDAMPFGVGFNTATVVRREEGMFFGLLEDRDGNIWQGSLSGVCRYDGETFDCFLAE